VVELALLVTVPFAFVFDLASMLSLTAPGRNIEHLTTHPSDPDESI
jgi:hypothetical protein